jgi:hypothetical protein
MSDPFVRVDRLVSSARLGGREIVCDGINANRCNVGRATLARASDLDAPTSAQEAALSVALAAGGNMTDGVHYAAVTFATVTDGEITDESTPIQYPSFQIRTDPNTGQHLGQATLQNLPVSPDPTVNARIIYLTKAGESSLYRLSAGATVLDNSTTSYTITVADAAIGAAPGTAGTLTAPTEAQLDAMDLWQLADGNLTDGWHYAAVTFATVTDGVITAESAPIRLPRFKVRTDPESGEHLAQAQLRNLPIATDPAVNARVVYLSPAFTVNGLTDEEEGDTTVYRVGAGATVLNNTATEYTINVADASLTATVPPSEPGAMTAIRPPGDATEPLVRLWGVRPPTAAQLASVVATPGSGGSMTAGDHIVAIAFAVCEAGVILAESGPIQLPKVTVAANGKIALTSLPVSDNAAVNARVIYMTVAGGTELYRVSTQATVADNTTTSYNITVADGNLTALTIGSKNEFIPAACYAKSNETLMAVAGTVNWTRGTVTVTQSDATVTFVGADLTRAAEGKSFAVDGDTLAYIVDTVNETAQTCELTAPYQGATASGAGYRLFGAPNTVYFGNPLPENIEGYDVLNPAGSVDVKGDDRDQITALGLCRGNFIVGKERSMHLLVRDTAQWNAITVSTEVGCASHHTMVQDGRGNAIWYGGAGGVYLMTGGELQSSTNKPACISENIAELLRSGVNHARDRWAHAIWYEPRQWYMLWVTADGEDSVTDLCVIADFSNPKQISWWRWQLPAAYSRVEKFSDDETRALISNYHGQILVVDTGLLDGVSENVSCTGVITAVNEAEAEITCAAENFLDSDGGTTVKGCVLTVVSGAAKGQRRLVSSATATVLTVDTQYYGGWFSPSPAVGDRIMVGGYSSYWTTPRLSLRAVGQKRFVEAVVEMTDAGNGNGAELKQRTWARGRELYLGRTHLAAQRRDTVAVALRGSGENWQGEIGTTGPAQPWQLDGITIIAQAGGETR